MPASAQRVLQHPDDPRGALVVVGLRAHPAQQLRVRAADLDRNRAGVRRVGQQRPDQDEQLDPELGQPADELVGEPAPAHVRLDAVHEHDVAGQAGGGTPGEGEPRRRPDQALGLPRHHVDHRPVDLEVVEVIGVDRGDGSGLPRDAEVVDHSAGRFGRVVPPFECGDRHRVDERSFDVAELDDFTSARAAGPRPRLQPTSPRTGGVLPVPRTVLLVYYCCLIINGLKSGHL